MTLPSAARLWARIEELAVLLAASVLVSGCDGRIGTLPGEDPSLPGSSSGLPAERTPENAGYAEDEGGLYDEPAPTTRVARLTHVQWENSVRDLLSIDDGTALSLDFRSDPSQQGFLFDNDVLSLSVDETLWRGYQRAATEIAELVVGDSARLARILPEAGGDDDARARAFIEELGLRVHRRPLTDQQIDEYFTLYQAAAGLYSGLGDFESGIRLLLEAFLQSPHFIYRVEDSTEVSGDVVPLDGYEVASRLSYMIWNTMPDEELFALAETGELTRADVAATQAERLLADARAEPAIASFHDQLLELERYSSISPSPAFYPNAPDDLAELAESENELFVNEMVFERNGGYRELLTSTETFVNSELAEIYGLGGSFGPDFALADLDPAERRGYLTQIGFLASHATSVDPDPIHRGVFIAKRVACVHIGAPPGEIPPLPPPEGRTNRETVEDHTQKEGSVCATCHQTIINPFGFPFEHYDSIGRYRTEDNGHPVDAATDPMIGGQPVHVDNALELASRLAESPAVHECYAKHWLQFAYGRSVHEADDVLIERIGASSLDEDLSIKELIVSLVRTESFLTRSIEELP